MIYTSYFAKYKGNYGVAITNHRPTFWKGNVYLELGPPDKLLQWWKSLSKEKQQLEEYQRLYIEEFKRSTLDKLDVNTVAKQLDNMVLLCYENPKGFCHRHIVAEWLNEAGYECEELKC